MTRQEKIEAILKAARRPTPTVVRRVNPSTGKEYFVQWDARHNCTVGTRGVTEQEVLDLWNKSQDGTLKEFRGELESMTAQRLDEQFVYWTTQHKKAGS